LAGLQIIACHCPCGVINCAQRCRTLAIKRDIERHTQPGCIKLGRDPESYKLGYPDPGLGIGCSQKRSAQRGCQARAEELSKLTPIEANTITIVEFSVDLAEFTASKIDRDADLEAGCLIAPSGLKRMGMDRNCEAWGHRCESRDPAHHQDPGAAAMALRA
jgi:hypothetical protein